MSLYKKIIPRQIYLNGTALPGEVNKKCEERQIHSSSGFEFVYE
jgi:hypothetical protein